MKRTVAQGLQRVWFARSVEPRVLVGLSVALAVTVLLNRFGVLTPDTKPEIYLQPGQTARRFASPWLDTPNLGAPNYNVGVAPLAAFFALLEGLGIPAWLIMRIWRIALLLLAGWGVRLLVRHLLGRSVGQRHLDVAGVAAAIAYVANPYVIVGGGTTPTLQPYALLPWLVLCWFKGFRTPGWRWAVLAGLVLAGMGGLNAGIVPVFQLVVLVPVIAHAVAVERHSMISVLWQVTKSGLVFLALSAYWLVPALWAMGTGAAIAEATEQIGAINMANSYAEVIRGLGMWTLYGMDGLGPFDPDRFILVTSPVVILLSFGGPVLAGLGVRLSRSPARIFGATSVLVGALLMVGTFSTGKATVWGRAIESALDTIPGLVAFRTTNKVGAVLELGLAVLIGMAAAALSERLVTSWHRAGALLAAAAVTAGSIAPALVGGMFWIPMDVPEYWKDAARSINERGGDSRVLMVPGVGVPQYTWGYSGPDELGPSLFTRRPFVYRSVAPTGAAPGSSMLAEVDRRLHNGTLPPGTLSALAEYLRIGDVVARHDLVTTGDAARIEQQLDADPGLGPAEIFGAGSEAGGAQGPVTARRVVGSVDAASVAARPGSGALIVDGSGAAVPSLTEAGLLDHGPALLMSGTLDDEALERALGDGGRLVLTDSNARREWSNSNPVGVGPILSTADEPESTRTLFSVTEQTTGAQRGNVKVETDGDGLLFGPFDYGRVENAFDRDKTTAWRFGNFGTGEGNAVVVIPDNPMPMPSITLTALQSPDSRISEVRVWATTAGRTVVRDAEVPPWNSFPVTIDLGDQAVSRLRVEVTGVAGEGNTAVGFSEISIPGVRVARVVTTSSDLARRAPAAAADGGVDLASVDLDVLMERYRGDANGLTDEEARLVREFRLPDSRSLDISGTFRLAAGIADSRIDELFGATGPVSAESSSRLFGRPGVRASMAIDGSEALANTVTAWAPGGSVVGEWISVDFPTQDLESFTLTQNQGTSIATRVLVAVNDGDPFEASLTGGENEIVLPEPTEASRVRILITDRAGYGFVRFTDLGLPRRGGLALADVDACMSIGLIDGEPIRARVDLHVQDLLAGRPVPILPCDSPLELEAGLHRLGSNSDFAIDALHLATSGSPEARGRPVPLRVLSHSAGSIRVSLPSGCTACVLSTGQAYDPRWLGEADGRDLGEPMVVDGYAAGWRLEAIPPGGEITMHFGPRTLAVSAWVVSGLALLGSVAVLGWPRVRKHRETHVSAESAHG